MRPSSARRSSDGSPRGSGFNPHLTFASARGHDRHDAETHKLRSKLVDVGQSFVGFDKVVEEDTVKRRNAEMMRIAAAQEGIGKLERAMNSEIKRRVDANKQLQMLTEHLANGMLDRLQSNILVRVEKLAGSAESLTLRTTALEKGIAQFKGELPSKLQVDTAALVKEISELRKQTELDRQGRIGRDTALLRRLAELESGNGTMFDRHVAALRRDWEACKAEIEGLARTDDGEKSSTEKFRAFIMEEIAGMKASLAVAAQSREQTDDEIVEAMAKYTNALQKGLHAANHRSEPLP